VQLACCCQGFATVKQGGEQSAGQVELAGGIHGASLVSNSLCTNPDGLVLPVVLSVGWRVDVARVWVRMALTIAVRMLLSQKF
jgi:hypothetical protein